MVIGIIIGYILAFIVGALALPAIIFLRARRDPSWDSSNLTNIYRVVVHLAAHPSDFGKMAYKDGKRPFWYISEDELSEVVKTRPTKEAPAEDTPSK